MIKLEITGAEASEFLLNVQHTLAAFVSQTAVRGRTLAECVAPTQEASAPPDVPPAAEDKYGFPASDGSATVVNEFADKPKRARSARTKVQPEPMEVQGTPQPDTTHTTAAGVTRDDVKQKTVAVIEHYKKRLSDDERFDPKLIPAESIRLVAENLLGVFGVDRISSLNVEDYPRYMATADAILQS